MDIGASDRDRRASVWRNGDFLKLWGGETGSQIGTQITVLALPLTAVVVLGAKPVQLGLLTGVQYLPIFLVTPLTGIWLDRHRHRPLLFSANLGRAILFGLIPLLYAFGALTMTALYLIAFFAGLLTTSFDVGYTTYLPSLVTKDQLVDANAKLEVTYSVSEVVGPGIGGVLVQALTAPGAIVVDAVSYLAGALTVGWIKRPEARPAPPERRAPIRRAVAEGMRVTLRDPLLRPMVLQSACANLFQQAMLTLYVLFGVRDLHLTAGLLGTVLALGGLGGVFGVNIAPRVARRIDVGPTIVGSMLLSSMALALMPAAGGSKVSAVLILLAGFTVFGLGLAVFNVYSLSLRAAIIPSEMFGSVTSSYKLISHGALPVGALLGGLLGSLVGVRAALVVAVVPLIAASVAFMFSRVRTVTETTIRAPESVSA